MDERVLINGKLLRLFENSENAWYNKIILFISSLLVIERRETEISCGKNVLQDFC